MTETLGSTPFRDFGQDARPLVASDRAAFAILGSSNLPSLQRDQPQQLWTWLSGFMVLESPNDPRCGSPMSVINCSELLRSRNDSDFEGRALYGLRIPRPVSRHQYVIYSPVYAWGREPPKLVKYPLLPGTLSARVPDPWPVSDVTLMVLLGKVYCSSFQRRQSHLPPSTRYRVI